jgi:hypothetical protein
MRYVTPQPFEATAPQNPQELSLKRPGSLAALNVVAPPARRGEIIAAYYLVGYTCIAFAIPAVGFASARVGLPAACSAFTVAIGFLAAASTAIACLYSRQVPFAQQP